MIAVLISDDETKQEVSVDFLSPVDAIRYKNVVYVFVGKEKGKFVYEELKIESI